MVFPGEDYIYSESINLGFQFNADYCSQKVRSCAHRRNSSFTKNLPLDRGLDYLRTQLGYDPRDLYDLNQK